MLSLLPGGALSDGLGSSDLPGPVLNQSGGDFLCPFDANTQRNVTAVQQAGCKLRSLGPSSRQGVSCARRAPWGCPRVLEDGAAGRAFPPPGAAVFICSMPLVSPCDLFLLQMRKRGPGAQWQKPPRRRSNFDAGLVGSLCNVSF